MKIVAAVLFSLVAVIPAIPLIILVTRADKIRLAVEALERKHAIGLLSQSEFDEIKHELLHRSLWRRWKKPIQPPQRNALDVS